MNSRISMPIMRKLLALSFGPLLIYGSVTSPAVKAEPASTGLKYVRTIDTHDLFSEDFFSAGRPDLSGVGFPPGAHTLLVLDPLPEGPSFILVTPPKKNSKVTKTALKISDPVNIAFDGMSMGAKGYGLSRLFLWDAARGELITIKSGARNVMEPNTIRRFGVQNFGIVNPEGLTMDPDTGRLFVLDGAGAHIIAIQPTPARDFTDAVASWITLPAGLGQLRGLAFNPADNHLYVLGIELKKLYKFTVDGELVARLDIAGPQMGVPQGMVFVPSLDLTDALSVCHLYMVTTRVPEGEISEWALSNPL